MNKHPYISLPDYAYWRRAVSGIPMTDVDPVVCSPFRISENDKIATAGSCFAQHIARHLRQHGFNYYIAENAHTMIPPDIASEYNYGTYTARYGNIYTPRQLLQLMQRTYGSFNPQEDVWEEPNGSLIDPFRPRIQPGGFASIEEYEADRCNHFSSVRAMFESLDVFVFTLGLTEAWVSDVDGAVYPLCPGVAGGVFDKEKYHFKNFSIDEVTADMFGFIDELRKVNSHARIIVTVSPVPLVATAAERHVLVSTTYSKSVLRVACERMASERQGVAYFPSFEIITGIYTRGAYFAEDLRSVTEAGVSHVMQVFFRHFTDREYARSPARELPLDSHIEEMTHLVEVDCDEMALDQDQHDQ